METSTLAEALPNKRQQNGQRLERTVVAATAEPHVTQVWSGVGGLRCCPESLTNANTTDNGPPVRNASSAARHMRATFSAGRMSRALIPCSSPWGPWSIVLAVCLTEPSRCDLP
ncbi:hypothetical protein MRX96_032277 [Rhipicephalus microplus]